MSTDTDALVAFLRARFDEDEQVAKRVVPNQAPNELRAMVMRDGGQPFLIIDSARVLRDVAADRKLIAAYTEARTYYDAHPAAPAGEVHGLLTALKIRAERFDDQDGYDLAWRL